MKTRICAGFIIVLLLAALLPVPALADVIWEPNDDFYKNHSDACDYEGRSYTATGAGGTVTIWAAPGAKKNAAVVNNGAEFYVSFTYIDKKNEKWGVVEFKTDDAGYAAAGDSNDAATGWVRMSDMTLVYDYRSFAEDHQKEFKPYTGNYGEFENCTKLALWSYPGGKLLLLDEDPTFDQWFKITDMYTDGEGKQWGAVFYPPVKSGWVCISDPSGAALGAEATPPPSDQALSSPYVTSVPEIPKDQTPMLLLAVGLVAAVVVVTGVMIGVFWIKNKKATFKE